MEADALALGRNTTLKVGIQGIAGSFHDEARLTYFGKATSEALPADSFDRLAEDLTSGRSDAAIMAIENSIAGTILQNYRILREHQLHITGECYLRIRHQLLGRSESTLDQIREVHSHPMALNQCLTYLSTMRDIRMIETQDTAWSAEELALHGHRHQACIASRTAGQLYGLQVLAPNIEKHKVNYTRFFILMASPVISPKADKASIYIRVPDERGKLLVVLKVIEKYGLNLSKLQSYPVMGALRSYYFHLDIEFDSIESFYAMTKVLEDCTLDFTILGVYQRASIETHRQ